MWLDRVSNWGSLALESDALPTALCGLADQNVSKLFRMFAKLSVFGIFVYSDYV